MAGNRHGGSNPPLSASFNSGVVQLVERRTVNPYVTGSSPVTGASRRFTKWACPRGRRGRTANPISESTRGFESLRPLHKVSWGHSSVGRALAWHARGQGFDPPWLHHFQGPSVAVVTRPRPRLPEAHPPHWTHSRPASSAKLAAAALHSGKQAFPFCHCFHSPAWGLLRNASRRGV